MLGKILAAGVFMVSAQSGDEITFGTDEARTAESFKNRELTEPECFRANRWWKADDNTCKRVCKSQDDRYSKDRSG